MQQCIITADPHKGFNKNRRQMMTMKQIRGKKKEEKKEEAEEEEEEDRRRRGG